MCYIYWGRFKLATPETISNTLHIKYTECKENMLFIICITCKNGLKDLVLWPLLRQEHILFIPHTWQKENVQSGMKSSFLFKLLHLQKVSQDHTMLHKNKFLSSWQSSIFINKGLNLATGTPHVLHNHWLCVVFPSLQRLTRNQEIRKLTSTSNERLNYRSSLTYNGVIF